MRTVCVSVMIVFYFAVQGFPSAPLGPLDFLLALSEQETTHLQKDFKDTARLREWTMRQGLASRLTDPEKVEEFKRRFGVNDKALQAVLLDIICELSAKTGWELRPPGESKDKFIANMLLIEALKWLGSCADAEGKQFLMGIVTDNTKDYNFRYFAVTSYMYRADAQEMRDAVTRFLSDGERATLNPFIYRTYYLALQAYDKAENDPTTREVIVAVVSAALAKEEDKETFAEADKLLSARSKEYADSPQRKAAFERLNIPAEKGEQ